MFQSEITGSEEGQFPEARTTFRYGKIDCMPPCDAPESSACTGGVSPGLSIFACTPLSLILPQLHV